jgi:hypothetical protein
LAPWCVIRASSKSGGSAAVGERMGCVTVAGLILNIVGTVMLFFFGFPQPQHDEGVYWGLEDDTPIEGGTVSEFKQRVERRKALYRRLASIALGFLLVGFILQLADALRT